MNLFMIVLLIAIYVECSEAAVVVASMKAVKGSRKRSSVSFYSWWC